MTMPYYNHLVFVGVEEKGGVPSLYDLCLVNWLNCVKKLLIEGKSILALKQQLDDVCVGHVRRDIHQYVFQHKSRQTRGKQVTHYGLHPSFLGMKSSSLFSLWWMLLRDQERLPLPLIDIHPDFYIHLVRFLANNDSNLKSLSIHYNFILKRDYISAFKRQNNNLRDLILLNKIQESHVSGIIKNTTLESLKFESHQELSHKIVCEIICSQSETLSELDLRIARRHYRSDPEEICELLSRCSCLTTLILPGFWTSYKPLQNIVNLSLHLAKDDDCGNLVSCIAECFPNLKQWNVHGLPRWPLEGTEDSSHHLLFGRIHQC